MNNWLDLEKRFREIAPTLLDVRLDHQWGDAGEYWNLAGGFRNSNFEQFKMLALIAGQLLEKSLPRDNPTSEKILSERSFDKSWYRAIWELSNKQENYTFGVMQNEDGENAGHIYSAMIYNVVGVSANLCLRLHALYPIKDENSTMPNINISGGNIGILNAGKIEDIQSIHVNISNIRNAGHEELARAIEKLTRAIETSNQLTDKAKQEAIEQLNELSKQASQPAEKRIKPSIINLLISSLTSILSTTSDLSQIWSVWGPIIITFFSK